MPIIVKGTGSLTFAVPAAQIIPTASAKDEVLRTAVENYFLGKPYNKTIVYKITHVIIGQANVCEFSYVHNKVMLEYTVLFDYEGWYICDGTLLRGTVEDAKEILDSTDKVKVNTVIRTKIPGIDTQIHVNFTDLEKDKSLKKGDDVCYQVVRAIEGFSTNVPIVVLKKDNIVYMTGFRGRCPQVYQIDMSTVEEKQFAKCMEKMTSTYVSANTQIANTITKKMKLAPTSATAVVSFSDFAKKYAGTSAKIYVQRVNVEFGALALEVVDETASAIRVNAMTAFTSMYVHALLEIEDTYVITDADIKKISDSAASSLTVMPWNVVVS